MNHLFVNYELASHLKEKGFDEPCFGYYVGLGDNKETPFKFVQLQSEKGQFKHIDNLYHAPTHQQVIDWFREKHNLEITVTNYKNTLNDWRGRIINVIFYEESHLKDKNFDYDIDDSFKTYYETLNATIIKALKLI